MKVFGGASNGANNQQNNEEEDEDNYEEFEVSSRGNEQIFVTGHVRKYVKNN